MPRMALNSGCVFKRELNILQLSQEFLHINIITQDLRSFPTIYTLSLKSLDGRDSLDDVEINATRKEDLVVLDILFPLQPKRLWNSTILAYGCQSIVTNIVLSKMC